ncbi:PucR family transcriptional regulator [Blastococcus sp. BMG 814]|uniref:PucR family transcriptional regulator n=1 Tax=Blastococcus carthaginiensis TaxID=3050034 RepID=A0ABT9ICR2_9ACTN|nr:PucR family transcriptional regulator [Blastococcus carthaginiensis]MDP5182964.1 PucR family transcriptional regulator [Blastococcus carthaginiensis]
MLPTVAEVLDLPSVAAGRPLTTASPAALARPVRWVHVSEVPDIGSLLSGGELLLTTGIALPDDPAVLARYVDELADVGASALVVELGRRYTALPAALLRAARRRDLPLVALQRPVRFVDVTQAVHSHIVEAQFAQLQRSDTVHAAFTALTVAGASPADVLARVAELAGCPVVLENRAHQVILDEPAGVPRTVLLDGWETRSRRAAWTGTTGTGPEGWLVTPVMARGETWGRLVAVTDGTDMAYRTVVLERGATALAVGRLLERDRETLERHAHRSLLSDIVEQRWAFPAEIASRVTAAGLPVAGRSLVAAVVHWPDAPARGTVAGESPAARALERDRAEGVGLAARLCRLPALVGSVGHGEVGILAALDGVTGANLEQTLHRLADALRAQPLAGARPLIGVGSVVPGLAEARRSFQEASQAAQAAVGDPRGLPFYRLVDVRLRGLLHLLREDPRLQAFVERELAPLLTAHDADALLAALQALLARGGNKTAAAAAAHLSRPAFYARLARAERLLGLDLDAPESRLSLHVALLARSAQQPV